MQLTEIYTYTGGEKRVGHVGNEAWAINQLPLDGLFAERTREWIEASYLLSKIAHAFFPDNIPEPLSLEFIQLPDVHGIMRDNVQRKTRWVEGMQWDQFDAAVSREARGQLFLDFKRRLSEVGFLDKQILDIMLKTNFVYPDASTITYVDSLDPMMPVGFGSFAPTIEPDRLRESIRKAGFSSELRQKLEADLERYLELTGVLIQLFPGKQVRQ